MTSDPRPPQQVLLRWARTILPWAAIAVGLWLWTEHVGRQSLEGPAPTFVVPLRGSAESFDLAAHRGKTVVLNFWASYCPPCRAEAPVLRRAHEQLTQRGDMVLGLSVDTRSLPFADRLGMLYPHALATPEMLTAYRVEMLPTTVVVAPDGTIADSLVGEIDDGWLERAVHRARSRM